MTQRNITAAGVVWTLTAVPLDNGQWRGDVRLHDGLLCSTLPRNAPRHPSQGEALRYATGMAYQCARAVVAWRERNTAPVTPYNRRGGA